MLTGADIDAGTGAATATADDDADADADTVGDEKEHAKFAKAPKHASRTVLSVTMNSSWKRRTQQ
jgi:hypothetical protein